MSKVLGDIYAASGHFGATLNCGVVTVTVRNALGEHAGMHMSLHSWCELIEQSRSKVQQAEGSKETA